MFLKVVGEGHCFDNIRLPAALFRGKIEKISLLANGITGLCPGAGFSSKLSENTVQFIVDVQYCAIAASTCGFSPTACATVMRNCG